MEIAFKLTWLLVVKALTVLLLVVIPWALGWLGIVIWALARVPGARHGV